jgi:hypothetical protein
MLNLLTVNCVLSYGGADVYAPSPRPYPDDLSQSKRISSYHKISLHSIPVMEENQNPVLIQIAHELHSPQNSSCDTKAGSHLSHLRKEYNNFVQEKTKCADKPRRFDPLNYLPLELWCECLLFAISDDPCTILIYTLVSSEWRDKIFGNP